MRPVTVSLFCGAGGESVGKHLAFLELGVDAVSHAIDNWAIACETLAVNLPEVAVHCADLRQVTAEAYGLSRINLLWASPPCVHFSSARGGRSVDVRNNTRDYALEVLDRWVRVAQVDVLLMENVPEFRDWGPLDDAGNPIKSRRGEYFTAYVQSLRDLGYEVEWRALCAADYGDPTSRKRLILQAARDGRGVSWPAPTHRDPKQPPALFTAPLPPWRTAAECIDWAIPCPSIFDRKRPLAEATLKRIAAGLRRFLPNQRAYILTIDHRSTEETATSLELPLTTTTTKARHALVAAFLTHYYSHGTNVRPAGSPLLTITTRDRHGLVTAEIDKATCAIADIGLRMLEPHELARAMGFPDWFRWVDASGKALAKRDQVKMIGNAVPVGLAKALGRAVVLARPEAFGLEKM